MGILPREKGRRLDVAELSTKMFQMGQENAVPRLINYHLCLNSGNTQDRIMVAHVSCEVLFK